MLQQLILGGYTKRVNEGIRTIHFDESLRSSQAIQGVLPIDHPTYLCLSDQEDSLFSIVKEETGAGVARFKKNPLGEWVEDQRLLYTRIPACHLTYDSIRRCLYVSNYHLGRLDVLALNSQDQLAVIQTIQYGQDQQTDPTNPSHIHYAGISKDGRFLWVCDLGQDTVWSYQIQTEGSLEAVDSIKLPQGSGPRHLVEHPHHNWLYLVGELNNQTTLIEFESTGRLSVLSSWPNLSEEEGQAAGAAIKISQDGRYLYVSTRFTNQITVFAIDPETGYLTPIQEISTCGQIPRDFALSADEKWVFVGHQESDYLSLLERDEATGQLTFIHNEVYAPECVCVVTTQSRP